MKFRIMPFSLLLLSALVAQSCVEKEAKAPKETSRYVKVEQITNGHSNNQMVFNGKVEERSLTSLSFRVGGTLQKLLVNEGDYVRKGDLIASVDKRDYQLQVDTRHAQYMQAKGEYERYKELMTKSKIPENTYEKIESAYLIAQTTYENALNQLKDTELRAPVSGYVYEKFTENHQAIGPGQPIISILDRSSLEVVINVPEDQVLALNKGAKNYLSIKKIDVIDVPVTLSYISGKAGNDGLYKVHYILSNKDNSNILPGMTASLKVVTDKAHGVLHIPNSAVFLNDNKSCVWIYDETTQAAQKRVIAIADLRSEGALEVLDGLQKGEYIITAGVHSISEGQKVKPIKPISSTNIGGLL